MFASLDKFPFKTILIFLIAIIGLNITYYQHSKSLLVSHQKEKINIYTSTIASKIVNQSESEAVFDEMLARDLRSTSIAIKQSLDADFHNVTNEQLENLAKLLNLEGITLFERRGDDFVGVRSSDPKEINASSKTWGNVYLAHLQLTDRKPVDVGIGLTLENYWSGPISTASTDGSSIRKWGEYYDGTTNYIINPFVNVTDSLTHFRAKVGVDVSIQDMMRTQDENLLEIAVLNPEKLFQKGPLPNNRVSWYSDRVVENGSYTYRDESEESKIKEALETKSTIFYTVTVGGKSILKSVTPIDTSNLKYTRDKLPKIVVVATDYSLIEMALKQQLRDVVIFMIVVTLLAGFVIAVLFRITRRKNEGAVRRVQDVYLDNINSIVQSIKEQRHDIINHLTAISWMIKLQKYDSLNDYITPLIQDAKMMEYKIKAVEINIPALSGIIQAKLAQSEVHNIDMQVEFTNMANLQLTTIKTTDLVRIISNLIDNSFDATIELPMEKRRVSVEGAVRANQLFLQVENTCNPLSSDIQSRLFESGFSTKHGKKNKGLGLHIIKQLIERYRGTIDYSLLDDGIRFSIAIPLKQEK
ncbi:sensor histidine kinase [Paenibacillus roseipurpureus]|uniref:histidine kinase n=1 Tax=Paenibacillus roseopurpureus TaxID=2918901 RepID=A0AA96LLM5_9BACL|nr:GHKL domain-containing protein [Paenibacillus sp. MBLB1832]WNR42069.1 GHKL domain-containing protein [Paenibacillus sp. MBLB1832]